MLERPALPDDELIACLYNDFGVQAAALHFLPLGADPDTAVFRLVDGAGAEYFVKLRSGPFDEVTVLVPALLHQRGHMYVIPPLRTIGSRLYARCGSYAVVLHPFVVGRAGVEVELSAEQWVTLGRALHSLHETAVPAELAQRIPCETFTDAWREQVRAVLRRLDAAAAGDWPWPAADVVAHAVAALLQSQRAKVLALVEHADRLAALLAAADLPCVLCHADIHVWNLLITAAGALYIVDWDTALFAPKERDLMFFGSGLGGWQRPEQAAAFYQGYGDCTIPTAALAYYRCERIVQDIAVYCRELLESEAGREDRPEQLRQLAGQFAPGGIVEIALATASPNR